MLYVVTAPGRAETLAALAGVPPWNIEEAAVGRDVMLGEIAFDHPLFAPLAGAQFNDFTKIHFWKYRRIDPRSLGDARVLARFENRRRRRRREIHRQGQAGRAGERLAARRQPARAVVEVRALDDGPAGGARPAAVRRGRTTSSATACRCRSRTTLAKGLVVHKPDGAIVTTAPGEPFFAETDQPGSTRSTRRRALGRSP